MENEIRFWLGMKLDSRLNFKYWDTSKKNMKLVYYTSWIYTKTTHDSLLCLTNPEGDSTIILENQHHWMHLTRAIDKFGTQKWWFL